MKDAKGHGSDKRGGTGPGESKETKAFMKLNTYGLSKRMNDLQAAEKLREGNGPKSGPVPPHPASSLEARSAAARNAEQNEFQRTRITKGPHFLDPHDPRAGGHSVVKDTSVKGATHALVDKGGKVIARLYKKGSPAWR